MARYTGSVCRLCRREGIKLFLKADRCNSFKCAMEKRAFPPGQHGALNRMKKSEYGIQLREKQKTKRFYGILEKQFRMYFEMASKKEGRTGENLLIFIERRLDNFLIKSGILKSIKASRQFIVHGHILINGKKVDKPSFLVKENDVISIRDKSKDLNIVKLFKEDKSVSHTIPSWISLDKDKIESTVIRIPNRSDITVPVNEQLIVELYSK